LSKQAGEGALLEDLRKKVSQAHGDTTEKGNQLLNSSALGGDEGVHQQDRIAEGRFGKAHLAQAGGGGWVIADAGFIFKTYLTDSTHFMPYVVAFLVVLPPLTGLHAKKVALLILLVLTSGYLRHSITKAFHRPRRVTVGWRNKLNSALGSEVVHTILNTLLVFDLLTVVVGMLLEQQHSDTQVHDIRQAFKSCIKNHKLCPSLDHLGHYGAHSLHEWAELMEYLSLTILLVFLLENVLLLIANGYKFLRNPWHTLDLVVVVVSIGFELDAIMVTGDNAVVGLVVLARLWRFIRIGHGLHEILHDVHEHEESLDDHHVAHDDRSLEIPMRRRASIKPHCLHD
jgi:hypothetical protein